MKRFAIPLLVVFFFLPLLFAGCSNQQKLDARSACYEIGAIYNSCKMFYCDRDRWPETVAELERMGYLELDNEIRTKWFFTIHGTDSINASSTEVMSGGAGHSISFDILQGTYNGWRIKENFRGDF